MHAAIAVWSNGHEQVGHDVDVPSVAALARVLDGGNGVRTRGGVVDRDLLTAERIGVWIAGVGAHYVH